MKILIAGGTGFIGRKLCNFFLNNGFYVNILTRNLSSKKNSHKLKYFHWNPAKFEVDYESIVGVNVIINLSGKNVFSFWSKKNRKEILNSRVNSIKTLIKLIKNNDKLEHFISASATGIYKNNNSQFQDESSTNDCESFLGNVVKKWEDEIDKLSNSKILISKLRIGIVLSKESGYLEKLILINNLKINPMIDNGSQWQSWIHMDDLISATNFIIENKLEGVFNLVSPDPSLNSQLQSKVISLNKKPLISFSTPSYLAIIPFKILGISDFFNEIILNNKKVYPKKLLENGFVFKFDNLKKIMTL